MGLMNYVHNFSAYIISKKCAVGLLGGREQLERWSLLDISIGGTQMMVICDIKLGYKTVCVLFFSPQWLWRSDREALCQEGCSRESSQCFAYSGTTGATDRKELRDMS